MKSTAPVVISIGPGWCIGIGLQSFLLRSRFGQEVGPVRCARCRGAGCRRGSHRGWHDRLRQPRQALCRHGSDLQQRNRHRCHRFNEPHPAAAWTGWPSMAPQCAAHPLRHAAVWTRREPDPARGAQNGPLAREKGHSTGPPYSALRTRRRCGFRSASLSAAMISSATEIRRTTLSRVNSRSSGSIRSALTTHPSGRRST